VTERADVMRAAIPAIRDHLTRAEQALARRSWLVGEAISAADVMLFPLVKSLERAGGKPGAAALDLRVVPLAEQYPAMARWCARIEAIPGYERTFPPHWR
jgi:glutathione S-transferase